MASTTMTTATSPPTLAQLRAAANSDCTSETLARLAGYKKPDGDVIIVKHRSSARRGRNDPQPRDEYEQQYHRNCFYQFRNLRDARHLFFGIKDDEDDSSSVAEPSSK